MSLDDLYRDVILDHARRPRGAGLREPFAVEVHLVNPLCGDEVTMRLAVDGDGTVTDVSYEALGCSISVAATSVLAEIVTGRPVTDVEPAYARFHDIVTGGAGGGDPADPDDIDDLDDAAAFAGVSRFPNRVKCALLGWSALREALVRRSG